MADILHVLDSIDSIAALDAARAVVVASGHDGEVRLASTPIGYIWAPTEAEWLAAADRSQGRFRPAEPVPEPPRPEPLDQRPFSEQVGADRPMDE